MGTCAGRLFCHTWSLSLRFFFFFFDGSVPSAQGAPTLSDYVSFLFMRSGCDQEELEQGDYP